MCLSKAGGRITVAVNTVVMVTVLYRWGDSLAAWGGPGSHYAAQSLQKQDVV